MRSQQLCSGVLYLAQLGHAVMQIIRKACSPVFKPVSSIQLFLQTLWSQDFKSKLFRHKLAKSCDFVKAKEPEGEQKNSNSMVSPCLFLSQPVLYTPAICPQIKELMKSAVNTCSAGMLLSCLCTFFKLRLTCWHSERFAFKTDGRWIIWGDTLCPTHWKEHRTNYMMPLL